MLHHYHGEILFYILIFSVNKKENFGYYLCPNIY